MANETIRVAVMSPDLPVPPVKGGAIETLIYETTRHYQTCRVDVYSCTSDPELAGTREERGVRFHIVHLPAWVMGLQRLINRLAWKGWFGLYQVLLLRRISRIMDPDVQVIHLHNIYFCIPYLKQRFPRVRIVLHMHNTHLFFYPSLFTKYSHILKQVARIITVSGFIRDQIIAHDPSVENKTVVVHNGVSPDRFFPLADDDVRVKAWRERFDIGRQEKVVVFVGRVDPQKGIDILLDAFEHLLEHTHSLRLIVVGSARFAGARPTAFYVRMMERMRVCGKAVIPCGFLSAGEINELYNLADITVIPSLGPEAFPLVMLEAMAAGCPVVATRTGGIPEGVTDGERGCLVPPGDAAALAGTMERLLNDDHERRRLAETALRYIRDEGGWDKVAARYESVYREALEAREPADAGQGTHNKGKRSGRCLF